MAVRTRALLPPSGRALFSVAIILLLELWFAKRSSLCCHRQTRVSLDGIGVRQTLRLRAPLGGRGLELRGVDGTRSLPRLNSVRPGRTSAIWQLLPSPLWRLFRSRAFMLLSGRALAKAISLVAIILLLVLLMLPELWFSMRSTSSCQRQTRVSFDGIGVREPLRLRAPLCGRGLELRGVGGARSLPRLNSVRPGRTTAILQLMPLLLLMLIEMVYRRYTTVVGGVALEGISARPGWMLTPMLEGWARHQC